MAERMPSRFAIWVDGVGGFLACLEDSVTLGQACVDGDADIPILSDISRQHARIVRQDGDYLLEPLADVRIRGRTIRQPTLLLHEDEILLGRDTRVRFEQTHPLSSTARITLREPYRTEPRCDAVLLFAQSLTLGTSTRDHIVCPHWDSRLVFYQRDGQVYCRSDSPIALNGVPVDGDQPVTSGQRLTGETCGVTLEEV